MKWIHFWKTVPVKSSHFAERKNGRRIGDKRGCPSPFSVSLRHSSTVKSSDDGKKMLGGGEWNWRGFGWKKESFFFGNQDVFQKCWEEEEEEGRWGTEAPVGHKKCNTKQKKASRKWHLIVLHFFFFFFSSRLLPLLVLETVGRMSRLHGVSTYTMLASVVAGREGGLGWGSLHRHDVLDESCNGRDDEEDEWVMKKSKSEHMVQQEVKEIKVMLRRTDFCPKN